MFFSNLEIFWFYFLFFFVVSCLFLVLMLNSKRNINGKDKNSVYECGFDAYENARQRTGIHFFIVSLLFILFDFEIMYLFPFILNLNYLNLNIFFVVYCFLVILLVGFAFECICGVLNWSKDSSS